MRSQWNLSKFKENMAKIDEDNRTIVIRIY